MMTVPGTGQTWLGTPRTKKAEHGGKTSIGCGRLKEFRAHYVCIYIYTDTHDIIGNTWAYSNYLPL